jgi:hypothetical protein
VNLADGTARAHLHPPGERPVDGITGTVAVPGVFAGPVFAPAGDRVALPEAETDGRMTVYDLSGVVRPEPAGRGGWAARALGYLFRRPEPARQPPVLDLRPEWVLEPRGGPRLPDWHPPMAFLPDSRSLLTQGRGDRVRLVRLPGGTTAAEWDWGLAGLRSLAVAPDGLTAAAGGDRGRVVEWDLE